MPKINAQHFRRRANEARIAAQAMRNPEDKRMLLTIAENFEELAKRVSASSSAEAKGSQSQQA
jgi:hypothetical protein